MNVKSYLTLAKEDCVLIFLEHFCVSVRRDSFCLRTDSHVKVCFLPDICYGSVQLSFGSVFVRVLVLQISMNVVTAAVCAVMVSVRTTWEDTSVGVWRAMAPTLSTHHVQVGTITGVKFVMVCYFLLHSCKYSWKGCSTWQCHCQL